MHLWKNLTSSQQVAHAFVPEGTRMVTHHLNHDIEATELNTGSALLMGARMLAETLGDNLQSLPEAVSQEHAPIIEAEIQRFYAGVLRETTVPAVRSMVEGQQGACIQKLHELLQ